jgi:hypothetical protein
MTLRDDLAEFFHEERDRWSDQQLADRVLAWLRGRGTEMYHGMTISWHHDGALYLFDLGGYRP